MARYIAGYNGSRFIDLEKATDLKQSENGKVYLVNRDGKTMGNGINVAASENNTLTVYDDETGEISTILKANGFTYEEIDD